MLKALEIVGFKSFADKTRFDFPPGITVVVGPNGSGKSNIVDAIKWVLGEQSVKSLRGKEMADVIFNGSGTRRPLNSAEITLTFDNSHGRLPAETPEVHITRRVYRSGEGEYLINRQPSRLRDIKDLLAGTGLGSQAYSVIEQGKVDVLLQASPRDRRMIFEEAAGISRFKAKKIEALRRLERVELNLLRLSDIVDEVENRLRSVRTQAGKARRYKEHSDRLQELRTQVALVDWARLSEQLAGYESELRGLEDQRDAGSAEIEAIEAALLEAELRAGDITESIRQSELQIAAYRERIAAAESSIEHERARGRDLEEEIARHRRQMATLNVRAVDLQQQLCETSGAVESAQQEHRQVGRRVAEGERQLSDLLAQLDHVRGESQQRRSAHVEQMRLVAALGNEISRLESAVSAAKAARERYQERLGQLSSHRETLAGEMEGLRREQTELARRVEEKADQLSTAQNRLAERREHAAANQLQLGQLHRRQTAMAERISVLEELENRCEGLSPGVKDVLNQAREGRNGPFRGVCGLVADLFRVSVEAAPLVETVLGDTAQHVVVRCSRELLDYLAAESSRLVGRVGFVWLDTLAGAGPEADLDGLPGVVGRCDRFVETEAEYKLLARRLLGFDHGEKPDSSGWG
ncbi:MAG: AAA family ATPase [Pirellulales bacterium]|nr:AAA family ATPase [Pirellulales bacterium]